MVIDPHPCLPTAGFPSPKGGRGEDAKTMDLRRLRRRRSIVLANTPANVAGHDGAENALLRLDLSRIGIINRFATLRNFKYLSWNSGLDVEGGRLLYSTPELPK